MIKLSTIWTVGHSVLPMEEFIQLLKSHGIEAVADVRRFPGSRRHPQFGQPPLREALAADHIVYHHFAALGGRRRARADSPNTAWRNDAFRGYADYMMTVEFREAITDLLSLAAAQPTAILCAEVLWWRCHRSLISDYLKAGGWEVRHILGPAKTVEHRFTSAAHLVDGKLSYSLPASTLEFTFEAP